MRIRKTSLFWLYNLMTSQWKPFIALYFLQSWPVYKSHPVYTSHLAIFPKGEHCSQVWLYFLSTLSSFELIFTASLDTDLIHILKSRKYCLIDKKTPFSNFRINNCFFQITRLVIIGALFQSNQPALSQLKNNCWLKFLWYPCKREECFPLPL